MPVSNIEPYFSVASHGGNTYPFAFKIFDQSELVVKVDGTVKTLGLDYTVTITAEPGEGGSIIFQPGYIPAAGTLTVEGERAVTTDRSTDYQEAGGFRQSVVDKDFDRLVMMAQDSKRGNGILQGLIDSAFDMIAQLAATGSALLENFSLTFKPIDIITKGPWIDARAYPTFAEAVAAAIAASKALMFSVDQNVTANLVVPANVELLPLNGAVINHGAYTISYAGSTARWPLAQVFSGTGVVTIYDKPKPQYYGAKGDGVTDDYAALSRFFASLGAVKASGEMKGDFRTSAALTFTGGVGSSVEFDASITATDAMSWVLKFASHSAIHFPGKLEIFGAGSNAYTLRTCTDGIVLEGCRGSKFDKLRVERFLRYGVLVSATGNNTLLNLGDVRAYYCGSAVGVDYAITKTYNTKSNTGVASSTAQRSVFTLDNATPPANLAVGMMAVKDGEPYYITAIAGNQITVYPWIKDASATGSISFLIGAGVRIEGDDAASVNFDSLDITYCAAGLRSASLYGFKGKRLISQFCGAGLVVGNNTTSGYFGNTLESFYCEGNTFDIIKTTAGTVGLTINGIYIVDFAKVFQLAPRIATLEYDGLYSTLNTVMMVVNGTAYKRVQGANGLGGYATTYALTADNSIVPIKGGNSVSISLAVDAGAERNFGHNHITMIVYGRRTGGRVDSVAFTPANVAHTIMGAASYTVAGVASVMLVTAWFDYEANNWVISAAPLQKATSPLSGSAAPATTPDFIGQEYLATSTSKWYKAKGTASSADWLILN